MYGGDVDQAAVVQVLEESHVVEEDKAVGVADTLEEAWTKSLPYAETFPLCISAMSTEY